MWCGDPPPAIDKQSQHRYAERRVNLAQTCPLSQTWNPVGASTLLGNSGSELVALVGLIRSWTRAKRYLR
jgi:hypothetical protein